jgi:hypothetical protein
MGVLRRFLGCHAFFFKLVQVRFPTNIPIPPNAEVQASDVGLEDAC